MNNQLFLCMSVCAQLLAFFHAFSTQSLLPAVESSKFYGWIQHKLSKQTFTVEACTEISTHAKRGVSLTALHTSTSILVGCILSWNRELIWLSARLLFLLPCYFPSWLSSATRLTAQPHTNTHANLRQCRNKEPEAMPLAYAGWAWLWSMWHYSEKKYIHGPGLYSL